MPLRAIPDCLAITWKNEDLLRQGRRGLAYLMKSTLDQGKRRDSENQKIKFGKLHFETLSKKPEDTVDFKDCVTLQGALASLTNSQAFEV